MTVADRLLQTGAPRAVKNRLAGLAYPPIYRLRGRLPRYSLPRQAATFRRLAAERGLGDPRRYATTWHQDRTPFEHRVRQLDFREPAAVGRSHGDLRLRCEAFDLVRYAL